MRALLILSAILMLGSCSVRYVLVDTASDTITEFSDDYYVSYSPDSLLELHYNLWSEGGAIWLSVMNRSDKLVILKTENSHIRHEGLRYQFDPYADWETYSEEIREYSSLSLTAPESYLPLLPGQWKSLIGPRLDLLDRSWTRSDSLNRFTKADSPASMEVRFCYHVSGQADSIRCVTNDLWVEEIARIRRNKVQELEEMESFYRSDKFYVAFVKGSGALLSTIIGLAIALAAS